MALESKRYADATALFYGTVGVSAATMLGIAWIANPGLAGMLRLALVVLYFLAVVSLAWAFTTPLREFLESRFALRYFDSGQALEHSWKLLVHNICSVVSIFAWAVMVLAVLTMLRVLLLWPQFAVLAPLEPAVRFMWWVALFAVPASLLYIRGGFTRIVQSSQQLNEQVNTSNFRPRSVADALDPADEGPAVDFPGDRRFRAGGFDWEWDDFYKSAIIIGQPGSGKTACVLNALLDGLIGSTAPTRDAHPASGLLLDPKGDFRDKIRTLMAHHGRGDDLLIIDPESPSTSMCWNPLDNSEQDLELANGFVAVLRVLGMKNEQDSFWIDSAKTFIRHVITLLRAASPAGMPPSLVEINAVATNLNQARGLTLFTAAIALQRSLGDQDQGWRGIHRLLGEIDDLYDAAIRLPRHDQATFELRAYFVRFFAGEPADRRPFLEAAWRRLERHMAVHGLDAPLPEQSGSVDDALNFLVDTWIDMADDTRSGVRSYLSNMLDPFLTEPYRRLFNGKSTMQIGEAIDQGKVIYVHMPIAKAETMAKVVSTFVKLEFYREVLKRLGKPRPSFFFCDEFQSFFTVGDGKGDADFFERSRQSVHANVIATQNLEALYKVTTEEAPIRNLLSNCALKLFLRNTDERTNSYASDLFGEALEGIVGSTRSAGGTGLRSGGDRSTSISSTVQYGAVVRKEVFAGLAQPSRADQIDYSETIVHLGSRGRNERLRLRWPLYLFDRP